MADFHEVGKVLATQFLPSVVLLACLVWVDRR